MLRAGFLLIVIAVAPARVSAQEPEPMQEATFGDATGAVWGVAAFESWLLLGGAALAASDGCGQGDDEELGCAGLFVLATVTAGVASGLAAEVGDAPPELPFLGHHGLWGGLTGLMLGLGISGDDDATRGLLAVTGFLGGAIALGVYAWTQRDYLLHDERAATGVHVMTWGVPVSVLVGALVGLLIEDDDPTAMGLVAGIAGLATYGVGIAIAEGGR